MRRPWTDAEDAALREAYPHTPTTDIAERLRRPLQAVYRRAYLLGLSKSAEYLASPAAGRVRRGERRAVATEFKPGHPPANKGLRRPGWAPGRMAQTQFRPDQAPHNTVPIGTEVVRSDGYVWVKRWDDRTPARLNWTSKHQAVYEAAHGPIPDGHIVRFRNADRTNIALENLECVSRAEHAATKGLHSLPPEIVQVHQLRGAITRQINKRQPPAPSRRGRPPKHAMGSAS